MGLDIGDALRDGLGRTTSESGLLLLVVFVGFGFVNLVLGQSLLAAVEPLLLEQMETMMASFDQGMRAEMLAEMEAEMSQSRPFVVEMTPGVAAVLVVVAGFVAEALRIVAIRVFARESDDVASAAVTDGLGMATLHGVVAGILAGIAVVAGSIFFLLPGIYVALSFFFVRQEIALRGRGFLDALQESWALTDGSRWELLALGALLFVLDSALTSPTVLGGFDVPTSESLATVLVDAVLLVFSVAVVTRAYQQLRAERDERLGRPDHADPTSAGDRADVEDGW
jgi:hypothetical protein